MQKSRSFVSIANSNYIDDSALLLRIFLLPTILTSEVKVIAEYFEQAIFEYFHNNVFEKMPQVTKRLFKLFLNSKLECTDKLLNKWKTLCWNLIPTVHRLIVYDESQLACMHNADVITDKYKWREACICYDKKLIKYGFLIAVIVVITFFLYYRRIFRAWTSQANQVLYIRIHLRKKYVK